MSAVCVCSMARARQMHQQQLVAEPYGRSTMANLRDAAAKLSQGRLREGVDSLVLVRCLPLCVATLTDTAAHQIHSTPASFTTPHVPQSGRSTR